MQMTAGMFVLMPATALAGVVLLAWSRHGRRVDDHPLCRRCGFDLTGRPEGSQRCPECGADLKRRRAMRIGHRRRRTLWIALALVIILAPIGITTRFLWPILSDPNPDRLKPVWWLSAEATHFGGIFRNSALDELIRRESTGALKKEEIDPLIDAALAQQADLSRPWFAKWGDLVEEAEDHNHVPTEKWHRYLRQSLGDSLKLQVRARVRTGDPLPARVVYRPSRTGSGGNTILIPETFLADQSDPLTASVSRSMLGPDPAGQSAVWFNLPQTHLGFLCDGEHIAAVSVLLAGGRSGGDVHKGGVERLTQSWSLLPSDASVASFRSNPPLANKIRGAVRAYDLQITRSGSARVWLDVFPVPADIAFEVSLRTDKAEVPLGEIARPAGQPMMSFPLLAAHGCEGLRQDEQVELVFHPSREVAARTVDLTEIWDGQIIIPKVPVIRADAAVALDHGDSTSSRRGGGLRAAR